MLSLKCTAKLGYNNSLLRVFTLEETEDNSELARVILNENNYLEEFTYKNEESLLSLFNRIFDKHKNIVNILIPDFYVKNKILSKYANMQSIPHISKYCVQSYDKINMNEVSYNVIKDANSCGFEYLDDCITKYTQGYLQNFETITATYNGENIGAIIYSKSARFIIGIYVLPKYRRNGIGSLLLSECLNDEYIWNADIDEYSYYFFDINGFKIHRTERNWCVKALGELPFAMDKMFDKKHVNVANLTLYYQYGLLEQSDYDSILEEIIGYSNVEFEYGKMAFVYEFYILPQMKLENK